MNLTQWLSSLLAAVIGGAATAGGSWLAINAAGAAGATVPQLNIKALGIILAVGALTNLFMFLKQSPIPTSIHTNTVTVTKTEETKAQE